MATGGGDVDYIQGQDRRILLIGKTGAGKSSVGNALLGGDYFDVRKGAESCAEPCRMKNVTRNERTLLVVDTPGFYDTHRSEQNIVKELTRTLCFLTPGVHAVGFVMKNEKFTDEMEKTKDLFFNWFGDEVGKRAFIIFTHGDTNDETPDSYFGNASEKVRNFKQKCGNCVIPFSNRETGDKMDMQVTSVLEAVDKIVADNGGGYFSNLGFRIAQAYAEIKWNTGNTQLGEHSMNLFRQFGIDISSVRERLCSLTDTAIKVGEDAQQHLYSSIPEGGTNMLALHPDTSPTTRSVGANTSNDMEPPTLTGNITIYDDFGPWTRNPSKTPSTLPAESDCHFDNRSSQDAVIPVPQGRLNVESPIDVCRTNSLLSMAPKHATVTPLGASGPTSMVPPIPRGNLVIYDVSSSSPGEDSSKDAANACDEQDESIKVTSNRDRRHAFQDSSSTADSDIPVVASSNTSAANTMHGGHGELEVKHETINVDAKIEGRATSSSRTDGNIASRNTEPSADMGTRSVPAGGGKTSRRNRQIVSVNDEELDSYTTQTNPPQHITNLQQYTRQINTQQHARRRNPPQDSYITFRENAVDDNEVSAFQRFLTWFIEKCKAFWRFITGGVSNTKPYLVIN